jgi:hypothetical protein
VSRSRAVATALGAALLLSLPLALVLSLGSNSAGAAPTSQGARRLATKATSSKIAAGSQLAPAKASPNEPPLSSPTSEGEETTGVPSAQGDQLVENGLTSPLCEGSTSVGLSSAAQSNCRTSGFVGASAPTNDYDLDVNIDTGALGLSNGELLSVIQDVFVAPIWEALVWIVHALVVMLQWCYALELLGGSTMSAVARSLREAQESFTEPWLALALAAASVLTLYNGLVRRRAAETLGHALLTIAMMALGLWMIADPLGTVGAIGQFANQASLGTLGATAKGTTADAPRTLGDSMRALFAGAIEMPWCYLEFGNVRWCSDPASLDSRLRSAAVRLAASEQAKLACQPSSARPLCSSAGEVSALTVERTNELVREADTNGALFLAFPANGPERNSVKSANSLLHVLCQSEEDTKCEGSTAAQAEFRSDAGTFPRMIGVVLIAMGVLGMTMLFGLLAIDLLASAVLSLFLLLLAPFAVLVPVLGEAGRALFTGWLTRLLGAVSSKLVFSFVLGALLTMQRMLASLEPLGWWTQWLLISAFWWVVFLKRHQALAFVRNAGRGPTVPAHPDIGRRIEGARDAKRAIAHPVRWAKSKLLPPLPIDEELRKRGQRRKVPTKQTAERGEERGQEAAEGAQRPGRFEQLGDPLAEQPQREATIGRSELAGKPASTVGAGQQAGELPSRSQSLDAQPGAQSPGADIPPVWQSRGGDSHRADDSPAKPTRLERATRLAVNAGGPELAEAARLAGARQPQPSDQPQPPEQPQPTRQNSQPSQRPLNESAGTSRLNPTRAANGAPANDPRGARMRSSREIMDDVRELAARRKRQLGLEPLGEDEPSQ